MHVASAAIGGAVQGTYCVSLIESLCTHAHLAPDMVGQAQALLAKGLPTLIGLLAIPWIIHPIDSAVDWVFNSTLRPWLAGRLGSWRQ